MARKISVEIIGDSSSLVNAFRRSSRASKTWNSDLAHATRGGLVAAVGFRGLGRSIAFASASFVGGAGLVAALKASVEGFTNFQRSMQKTVGLANVAQSSVSKFSKQILELGPIVGKGPQELAEAFYFVASSGIAASKAMSVVRASARASVAGLGDTATVADAITSVINAYGAANISAAKAADILTATVREGKGEAADFAPVIGNVVALASQLGVSFDQVGAALAAQTRLGTDAETTAIQLQRVFGTLLKVTPKSAEAFASVGLRADDLRKTLASPNGLIKVLEIVKAAFAGNTPALAQAFGDIRALRGILNLVGKQAKGTQEVFDRLAHSTGSADKAFKAVDKTASQSFAKLKASAQVAGIALGAIFAPLAVGAAKALTAVTNDFTKFVNRIQAAKGFQAKINIVTTGLRGLAGRVGHDALEEFNKIDFRRAAEVGSAKLRDALNSLRDSANDVDWDKVGRIIVKDIADFLKGVDWVGLFKGIVKLWAKALRSAGLLLQGATEELMKQVAAGIKLGAQLALLEVEKFALEMVKKITGATGFLGRFDPFKGIKEKAQRRLQQIQADIDKLHGKTVNIRIDVTASIHAPEEHGRGGTKGAAAAATKAANDAASAETAAVDQAAIARAKAAAAAKRAAAAAEKSKQEAIKAFQDVVDSFSFAEEKAAGTKSLRDDIRVQKEFQAAILREMKVEGKTTDLMRQLFESRQKVAEDQQQLAQNAADARKKAQFIALGLTAEGEKPAPSSGALLRRTNSLQQAIKGTVLDTTKTNSQLNRIRNVLKRNFKSLGRDVRQAILDMLNDISDAANGGGTSGPLTKTHGLNTKKIVQGLGLDADQVRELRSRLSSFNTAGRELEGALRPPSGRPGGRGDGFFVAVESTVNLNVDGKKFATVVSKSQQRASRSNPRQRRGLNRHR